MSVVASYTLREIATRLGGEVSGNQVLAPAPGHSPKDRGLAFKKDSSAPDGYLVHLFNGGDPIAARDYVREKLSLPPFTSKRRGKSKATNGDASHGKPIMPSKEEIERATAAATAAMDSGATPTARRKVTATYGYHDEARALLYVVERLEPKSFRQRSADGTWNLAGVKRVPFRLPEILADDAAVIFFTEGERDALRLVDLGLCATTLSGGTVWTPELAEYFRGREIVIVPDYDAAGVKRALEAANALHSVAATIKIIFLPGLDGAPGSNDASDWLNQDSSRADIFADTCLAAPLWVPGAEVAGMAAAMAVNVKEAPAIDVPADDGKPLILSSADFVKNFFPPDYLWDGVLQRRFIYSLTAKTGDGKTAIALLLAASIALGLPLGGRAIEPGRVIYFAGENPDDVRMRWIAMARHMKFDVDTINVGFVDGVFSLTALEKKLRDEIEVLGGASLIVVDTSAAFFLGDAENDNVQMLKHARQLRDLVKLPGGPTVLAACHPVKNAAADNLLPRGGGAFLNEMDGNVTASRTDMLVALHWQGKFRGPDFEPMTFELLPGVTAPRLVDTKGRQLPSVIAKPLSDLEEQARSEAVRNDENDVLIFLIDRTDAVSYTDIADGLHWLTQKSKPYRMKAKRAVTRLQKDKLVTIERGGVMLTERGKKTAEKEKYNRDAKGATYG